MVNRYMGFSMWARIVIAGCIIFLGWFLISNAFSGIKHAIFGNPEVKRERAAATVARENTKAEAAIADNTIEQVHERDVYREHVREIVRVNQERVNAADTGQRMDPAIDAAVAAGLCGVHDSLCRSGARPAVQPVREPVPGED